MKRLIAMTVLAVGALSACGHDDPKARWEQNWQRASAAERDVVCGAVLGEQVPQRYMDALAAKKGIDPEKVYAFLIDHC